MSACESINEATDIRCSAHLSLEENSDVEETKKKPMMLAKTVIVLAIAMSFQSRRTLAEWRPLQTDDGGVDARRYDQYDAVAEDSEADDAGDGGGDLRAMNLIDFAGRGPTDMNDNSAYVLASSSADEDSADAASSLDLGRYVGGATETQGTDNRWPTVLSVQPPRKKRDASKLNPQTMALQMKPQKAIVGSSKAVSADMKDWPLLRSKRRTRPQSELQRMIILSNLLNEDDHYYDGRGRIRAYDALKRAPASYQAPPAKSRVAAGMRYAGIGKRKVNVRSRVDAGMRYMGIGKRHY